MINAKKTFFMLTACTVLAVTISASTFSAPRVMIAQEATGKEPLQIAQTETSGVAFAAQPVAASENDVGTQRVTADVSPAGTPIEWSLSWQDPGDDRAMEEYLSIAVVDEAAIDLTCHRRFTGTAILRCEFESNPDIYDTATVTAGYPESSTDLLESQVTVFALSGTDDAEYENQVTGVCGEMDVVSAGATICYTTGTEITGQVEGLLTSGETDVFLVYDYADELLNGIETSVLEEINSAMRYVFFSNTTPGAERVEELSDYVSGFIYGAEPLTALYLDEFGAFGYEGNGTVYSLTDTGAGTDDGYADFIAELESANGFESVAYEFDADDYADDPSMFLSDFGDMSDAEWIILSDSRFFESLITAIADYGSGIEQYAKFLIWHSDGTEDYLSLLPDGNYVAYTYEFHPERIAGYISDTMNGESVEETYCTDAIRL